MKRWKISVTLLALMTLIAASVVMAGDMAGARKADMKDNMKSSMKGDMQAAMTAEVAIDKPAPDFTLMGVDGKEYSLSDFKGKDVVLEWINFDCPFVKKHYHSGNMPMLQKKYGGMEDVVWLSICSSAPGKQGNFSDDEILAHMKDFNWHATAYLKDSDGMVGRMYGAKTTPHMFVIDKEGVLRYAGAIDNIPSTRVEDVKEATNYVSSALDEIMAKKAVATKTSTPYGCGVKYGEKSQKEANKTM